MQCIKSITETLIGICISLTQGQSHDGRGGNEEQLPPSPVHEHRGEESCHNLHQAHNDGAHVV